MSDPVQSGAPSVPLPDAVTPPPGNPRFPLFEGMRAIAALAILVSHVTAVTGYNFTGTFGRYTSRMTIGVALFFVISGFLLYRPFVAARFDLAPPIRIRDYLRRRALRVVPAYWLALTVLAATVGLVGVFSSSWWTYYFFLQNYNNATVLGGIGPAWSLCVEVSFYLALPMWVLLGARISRGRPPGYGVRIEAAGLLAIALVSLSARTISYARAGVPTVVDTTLLGNADWFTYGMGLALVSVAATRGGAPARVAAAVSARPWLPWGVAAILYWILSTQLGIPAPFGGPATSLQFLEEHIFFPVIGLLLLLPAVFAPRRRSVVRAILGNRVLAWLGLISYGIFLWHDPLLVQWIQPHFVTYRHGAVATGVFTVAASVLVAAASYYVVERPFLRLKDRRPRARAGPVRAAERPEAATGG